MKNIIAIAVAVIVAFVLAKVFFMLFSVAFSFAIFSIKALIFLFIMGIFGLPIYIIVKKSLIKGKRLR